MMQPANRFATLVSQRMGMQCDELNPKDGYKLPFTLIPFQAASLFLNCHSEWPDAHVGRLALSLPLPRHFEGRVELFAGKEDRRLQSNSLCPHTGSCLQNEQMWFLHGSKTIADLA
jgi:hypothetical protein